MYSKQGENNGFFYNMYDYYNSRIYELSAHNPLDRVDAMNKIREWDYNSDSPIALGTFYRKDSPTFDETFLKVEGESVNSITRRSIPIPSPAVGGMPCSKAII